MRKIILSLIPLLAIVAASDAAADPPAVRAVSLRAPAPAEDDGDLEKLKAARKDLADFDTKLKPVLAADPRVTQLIKEATEIAKLDDRAARKTKLLALVPRAVAVRNDALKKAGIDPKTVEAKVANTRVLSRRFVKVTPPEPPPGPGSVITTTSTTSFPLTYSYKNQCPDSADKWDFDGAKVKVNAKSAIADEDCWKIRAGRGATVQVPAGTKKMKVVVGAKVDLDVVAMSFGAFGEAVGFIGIRVFSPSGAKLDTVNIVGKDVALPVMLKNTRSIHAENWVPNPIPVSTDGFADDLQEGDDGSTATFTFDGDPGPALEVAFYTGGWADADLQGLATVNNDLTVKSMKVTFYR